MRQTPRSSRSPDLSQDRVPVVLATLDESNWSFMKVRCSKRCRNKMWDFIGRKVDANFIVAVVCLNSLRPFLTVCWLLVIYGKSLAQYGGIHTNGKLRSRYDTFLFIALSPLIAHIFPGHIYNTNEIITAFEQQLPLNGRRCAPAYYNLLSLP